MFFKQAKSEARRQKKQRKASKAKEAAVDEQYPNHSFCPKEKKTRSKFIQIWLNQFIKCILNSTILNLIVQILF